MQQDDSLLLLHFPLFGWFWKMLSLYIYGCADSEVSIVKCWIIVALCTSMVQIGNCHG